MDDKLSKDFNNSSKFTVQVILVLLKRDFYVQYLVGLHVVQVQYSPS
jgi:hypothetical protein